MGRSVAPLPQRDRGGTTKRFDAVLVKHDFQTQENTRKWKTGISLVYPFTTAFQEKESKLES